MSTVRFVYYDKIRDRWLVRRNQAPPTKTLTCALILFGLTTMTCLSLQDTAIVLGATTPRCEVARVFRQRLAAEKYAKEHVGAFAPRSKTQQLCEVLKVLGGVYEMCDRPFVPADLADCIARHVADGDLFREEPGAELSSILLEYGTAQQPVLLRIRRPPCHSWPEPAGGHGVCKPCAWPCQACAYNAPACAAHSEPRAIHRPALSQPAGIACAALVWAKHAMPSF